MRSFYYKKLRTSILLVFLLFAANYGVYADTPSVTAAISSPVTQVGRPVQLRISLSGVSGVEMPETIEVDGLSIHLVSRSQQWMTNLTSMTASLNFLYVVVPEREGDFIIPSLQVSAGGKRYKTNPLRLRVAGTAARQTALPNAPGGAPSMQFTSPQSQGRQAQPQNGAQPDTAFAEIQVPKTECFVGETIPVTLRFLIDARVAFKFNGADFSGEGFTTPRLERPDESTEEIKGIPYFVLTFHTSVTPVKSGNLNVGPAKFSCIVQNRSESIEGLLAQFFSQSGGGGVGGAQQVSVESNPLGITVKPLPEEGKPADFGGAIGDFTLTVDATPKKVGPGEPITFKLSILGKGNFDAITAPVLTGEEGWTAYTPKETFSPKDGNPLAGKKTFEYLLIAKEAKTSTPGAEFSYFSPGQSRYVTLNTAGVPVNAPAPNQTPPPSSTADASAADSSQIPEASAEPTAAVGTKANPLPAATKISGTNSFTSPALDPKLWIAEAVAGALLLILIAFVVLKKINSGESARRRELQKQALQKWEKVSGEVKDRKEFYQAAITCLREETAARIHKDPAVVTTEDVITSRNLEEEDAEAIRRIFGINEELTYGAGKRLTGDIEANEQARVIEMLKKFNHSNAS